MSKFYTINSVVIGTSPVWPGSLYDDTVQGGLVAQIQAAGGALWPAEDSDVAAAAVHVAAARHRGQNIAFCESLMMAAVAADAVIDSDYFGTGIDGAALLDGTNTYASWATKVGSVYTQIRDVFLTTLTIAAGVTLITAGFRGPFVTSILINNGTIHNDGAPAALAVAGVASPTGSYGVPGTAGGAGGTTAAGTAGTDQFAGFNGGAGGAGGAGSTNAGAAGGADPAAAASAGGIETPWSLISGYSLSATGSIGGGSGGGGGGSLATGVGGGGGGAAGPLIIAAYRVLNNGVIRAKGGDGAPGSGSAAAGGGGGGGGGFVTVVTHFPVVGAGTVTAPGGAGGVAVHSGVAGTAGAAGVVKSISA